MSQLDRDLGRLRAADPVSLERAEQEARAPWVSALRARIESGEAERRRNARTGVRRPQGRTGALVVAGLAVLAGGGALAATVWRPSLESAPNTPAGERIARGFIQGIARETPQIPGEGPPAIPVPANARAVFSTHTRHGEYTIWRAGNKDSRGATILYSSPRLGMAASSGEPALPPAPFVVEASAAASSLLGARELWGRASAAVVRVQAVLKDGSRQNAILEHGWFLFTQDFGHSKPVSLLGYDRHNRVIARHSGPIV